MSDTERLLRVIENLLTNVPREAELDTATPEGQAAVRAWLVAAGWEFGRFVTVTAEKPPALIYLDDRGWRFDGRFPSKDEIHAARPWNKR